MSTKRFLPVEVGCLECGHSTYAEGLYDTVDEAREAAICGHVHGPFAVGDQNAPDEAGGWWGDGVSVIFDLWGEA
jgi:hypothetical protein